MAQKVLARSDLDLLNTEYYKKRLESQLNNRETYTTDHISTESTKLTGLRLPTDCFSNIKLLPAKFFPLTTPLLPLSLTLPIHLFIRPVPSCNHSCLHFDPKRKVSLCHSTITFLSVGTVEQFSKQRVKGKVTPVESISAKDSLKDSSSTSITIYSRAVIPYSGSLKALFFERPNIIDFFESYNRMCTDYQVDKQGKIKRLSLYCGLFTGKYIETLISSSRTS